MSWTVTGRQQANQIPSLESEGQGVPLMRPGDDGRSLTEAFPFWQAQSFLFQWPRLRLSPHKIVIGWVVLTDSDSNQSTSRTKKIFDCKLFKCDVTDAMTQHATVCDVKYLFPTLFTKASHPVREVLPVPVLTPPTTPPPPPRSQMRAAALIKRQFCGRSCDCSCAVVC